MGRSKITSETQLTVLCQLVELYESGVSTFEIRMKLHLTEPKFAELFLTALTQGLLRFNPEQVRGAYYGTNFKGELMNLLGVQTLDDALLLLRKTEDGVLVSIRQSGNSLSEDIDA